MQKRFTFVNRFCEPISSSFKNGSCSTERVHVRKGRFNPQMSVAASSRQMSVRQTTVLAKIQQTWQNAMDMTPFPAEATTTMKTATTTVMTMIAENQFHSNQCVKLLTVSLTHAIQLVLLIPKVEMNVICC